MLKFKLINENKDISEPGEACEMMITAMKEAIAVVHKEAVNLSQDDIAYWLNIIGSFDPNERPSMAQDVKACRSTKGALFACTVVKLAKKYGVSLSVF